VGSLTSAPDCYAPSEELSTLITGRAAAEVARLKAEAALVFGDPQGNLRLDILANPPPAPRRKS
jgi:hypothetical protein